MAIDNPADLIRVVSDPVRLSILGRAAEGRVSLDEVSAAFDIPRRKVVETIGKLRATGLLTDDLTLDIDKFRAIAANLPSLEAAAAAITDGPWTDEEKAVLARFFAGTRLTEIPTGRAKRRLVLERLAQEFEPGLRYQEADVSFTLQLYHPDYAALRRYLVEEGLLTRADGVYWRSGGRYPAGSGE